MLYLAQASNYNTAHGNYRREKRTIVLPEEARRLTQTTEYRVEYTRYSFYCSIIKEHVVRSPHSKNTYDRNAVDASYLQERPAKNFSFNTTVLLVETGFSFLEKSHQNTRRSRETAPADLEPPKGLGLGLGLGLGPGVGLVWSDVKVEISHTVRCRSLFAGRACKLGAPMPCRKTNLRKTKGVTSRLAFLFVFFLDFYSSF